MKYIFKYILPAPIQDISHSSKNYWPLYVTDTSEDAHEGWIYRIAESKLTFVQILPIDITQ